MNAFVTFTILGLVLGAVYAIAASGLVLTYNTSGIFNFAHGAQAMLGAFCYWQLRSGWGLPTPVALLITLGVIGPLMGWGLYLFIMKGLRNTAEVTKIVVTVSILLGAIYLSHWFWDPKDSRSSEKFFGNSSQIDLFGSVISTHDLIALVVAVLIAIGLRIMFTRTRMGVSMRGAVDDPDLLRLNGHNPERIAATSWAMGSVLAVLAGILITPISGGSLEANALTLLVIDAFAAAMFGKLKSIPRTFVGAIVLGLASTYVLAYFPSTWTWTSNFRISLPMIVLFMVLIVLPHDRLSGAAVRTRERANVPTVRSAIAWGAFLVVAVFLIKLLMVDSAVTLLTTGMTFAIIALSLTVLTGYAGQMNLAAISFGAVATVVVFHFGTTTFGYESRTTLVGVLLGMAAAAVVGGIVALPALRLRGLYLALATLAFGVFLSNMVLNDISQHELFGKKFSLFTDGNLLIPPVKVGPLDLKDGDTFLMTTTALFALIGIGLVALRNSGYGRRLAAMKDSEAASATLGQSLVRLKLSVFVISAAIAGLGGILMSSAIGSVQSDSFSVLVSLSLLMLTVAAGIGYVTGALFGGIMSGVGFTMVISTFNDLAMDHENLSSVYTTLGHIAAVSPALIGLGVGANPSGTVHQVTEGYRALRNAKPVLIGGAVIEVILYLLAYTDTIDKWWFGILTITLVFLLPVFGQMLMPEAVLGKEEIARRKVTPPELIGVDVPFSERDRHALDQKLGLPAFVGAVPTGLAASPAAGHHGTDQNKELSTNASA
ncbi:ABC transporter permease [Rhodococcus sp. X156]|uniref:ABC transporter permease n=1 Tax=Rhodococcus sp. X156 TaxID=2499145 RepID=UPI000FD98B20|nr:ABC transporter permease [Rhodococcus sp. X156]